MFDTVNFWINRFDLTDGNPFAIQPYLSDITESQNEQWGYSITGNIGDYVVRCSQLGISLKGSLAKHFLQSNVLTLTRATVKEALELLSDQLHLNMLAAKVNRLDTSNIVPTKRPPTDYYPYLGAKPRFERLRATENTLYYSTQKRQLAFYDKSKEAMAKNMFVPETLAGCNLLRYELRLTKELPRQLKRPEILGATLIDPDFYYLIVQLWKTEFDKINKTGTTMKTDTIKTPKEAQKVLFAKLLQQGGQTVIDGFIADLRAANAFTDPKYYSRLKAELVSIWQTSTPTDDSIIKELETAIADIARYAR